MTIHLTWPGVLEVIGGLAIVCVAAYFAYVVLVLLLFVVGMGDWRWRK